MDIMKFKLFFFFKFAHFFFKKMNLFDSCSNVIINAMISYKSLNELPIPPLLVKRLKDLFPFLCVHRKNKTQAASKVSIISQRSLDRESFETLLYQAHPFLNGILKISLKYFKIFHCYASDESVFLCISCAKERLQMGWSTFLVTEIVYEDSNTLEFKWHSERLKWLSIYFCRHCLRCPLITISKCTHPLRNSQTKYEHIAFLK